MIAGSLSSCIAGFHQSCRFSQSSGPRRSCVGIGPVLLLLALESERVSRLPSTAGDGRGGRTRVRKTRFNTWRLRYRASLDSSLTFVKVERSSSANPARRYRHQTLVGNKVTTSGNGLLGRGGFSASVHRCC